MDKQPRVCIVGSINMDMVTTTSQVPEQGETVLGEKFETYPGGKGANQAVAASRIGADVTVIGSVGQDDFGKSLLSHFQTEGIHHKGIHISPHVSTGIATIILSENDNRIIVAPGANARVTPEMIHNSRDVLLASDIILLQFEIPMETIQFTIDLAYKHQIPVIVNPAPFQDIPEDIFKKVTYFTPNEIELDAMAKTPLFEAYEDKMIVTKGSDGVQFTTNSGEVKNLPAYKVDVKDTTGAGDTCNGVLATELGRTKNIEHAVKFANVAAALSIQKIGAQEGMPGRNEVEVFMEQMTKQN